MFGIVLLAILGMKLKGSVKNSLFLPKRIMQEQNPIILRFANSEQILCM
jgi:hypothetical protein